MNLNATGFDEFIKKIRIKRTIAISLFIVCLLGVIFSAPWYLEVLDEVIINTDGSMSLVILFGFSSFACLFGYVLASMPIYNALFYECDAKKHLVMLSSLEKEKRIYQMLSNAYFYVGDYDTAVYYDKKAFEKKSHNAKLTALFGRARSEFFANKIDNFTCTASDFNSLIATAKLNDRQKKTVSKYQTIINLLLAITNNDTEKIKEYASCLQAWEETKITGSFINYLKGIASFKLNDKTESTYRFMSVCESASKTVLGTLAKEYLDKLNNESDTQIEKEAEDER